MGMDMLKGLATTLRELGKKPTTVSYPEEKRELPARYRGRHVLHRYENGLERCVGCFLCALSSLVAGIDHFCQRQDFRTSR